MEAEFEREVLDRLIKIEGKLDGYNNAKVKTYENEKEILRIKSDLEDVQKTVTDLTESNKWLFRTVVAAQSLQRGSASWTRFRQSSRFLFCPL